MAPDWRSIAALTYSLGSIGVIANLALITAIFLRTPANMRVYSRILAASAISDLVGIVAMMLSVTDEKVYYTAAILEFHGYCTEISVDFCCAVFGVQEYMYVATSMLLCVSFAYRLHVLQGSSSKKHEESVIIGVIMTIIIANSPSIPLYLRAGMRMDSLLDDYRRERGLGPEQPIGMVNFMDIATLGTCFYSIFSSLIPFTASIVMRKKIIRNMEQMRSNLSVGTKAQHDMLIKALNLQLLVSAFFLLGVALFGINLFCVYLIPGFPETTDFVVPLCNVQNVIGALTNLYVITPYRRWILCGSKGTITMVQSSLNLSNPSNDYRNPSSPSAIVHF